MFKRAILVGAVFAAAAALATAHAADVRDPNNAWALAAAPVTLPVKAPAYVAPSTPCTNTGCSGFALGANMAGVGQGVSVLNLGTLNAGGQYMGVDAAYQYLNGTWEVGVKVSLQYEVYAPTVDPIAAGGGLRNKLFAFEGMQFGGNLSQLAPNLAPVSLPGWLSTAVPHLLVGACQHGVLNGWCTGAGAAFYIPNSRWSLNLDYLNAQYGNTTIAPGQTSSVENRGIAGVVYHF